MADAQAPAAAPAQQEKKGLGKKDMKKDKKKMNPRAGGDDKKDWVPCTKLGRLVKEGKVESLENIFLFSMPIKEYQIVDNFIKAEDMKDEIMKIQTVQKSSSAGQRTRFKVYICIGDGRGHVGIGSRTGKEVATAIRAAIIAAKVNVIPVRRGYWGNMIGAPHTIPMKVTGKSGSVSVRMIPAPKGTGIVAAPLPTRILQMAGVEDVYTASQGKTRTGGNFIMAVFYALRKTYSFLTPDLWAETVSQQDAYGEHSAFLQTSKTA
uniref:Small ribosomal subunit protein uS5 n=1 Tax=Heterosigma akashiwo TaxID=2829 RepID=A0A7S3YG80_HETAK